MIFPSHNGMMQWRLSEHLGMANMMNHGINGIVAFPKLSDKPIYAVCQNLVPLVNPKIAGKWMFIPLKMVLIGIDPYLYLRLGYCLWSCTLKRWDWTTETVMKSSNMIQIIPHRIHGAAILMVTWIPSIYPIYVSINLPAPWILWLQDWWFMGFT